jgi:hypothetical protein
MKQKIVLAVIFISLALASCVTFGTPSATPVSRPRTPVTQTLPLSEAIEQMASELVLQLPGNTRIGFGDLLVNNRKLKLSDHIGTRLNVALARQGIGMIEVLERRALDSALAESQYNMTHLSMSPENVVNVGQFLPANTILVGSITIKDNVLEVSVRAFSTQSGTIVAASSVNIIRDAEVAPLIPMLY